MSELIAAYIEITDICNARCPYCYNERNVNKGCSLSYDALTRVVKDLHEHGVSHMAFSGGEPFLHSNLPDILAYAYGIGVTVAFISNGTCFDVENIPLLLRYNSNLQITFDGHDAKTHDSTRGAGNFHKLIDGVHRLKADGYTGKIALRHNLNSVNIDTFSDFLSMLSTNFDVDDLANRDFESISLAPVRKIGNYTTAFNSYIDVSRLFEYTELLTHVDAWNKLHNTKIEHDFQKPDVGCPYNSPQGDIRCGIRIAPNGGVFLCQLFVDESFCIGNINDQSLYDVIDCDDMIKLVNQIRSRKTKIDECKICAYSPMCGCGCPAYAYIENGTIDSITPRCPQRKLSFQRSISSALHGSDAINA
jgi:uncharacterized protein